MLDKNLTIPLLMAITSMTVTILCGLNYYVDYFIFSFFEANTDNAFDFIVIGAGSAGATVAHRLSKHNRVLLLEAGGDPIPANQIPGAAFDLLRYPQFNWMYQTVPQKDACFAFKNNISRWPRGKVLGGSSTLNKNMYVRGHSLDYDNWANITGDEEWTFKNVLPFFKKSVLSYRGDFAAAKKFHGNSEYGFLHIEKVNVAPLVNEFIQAGKELGYGETDVNGAQQTGFGKIEITTNNGERCGTYAAILRNPKNKHNLQISKYSQVVKIELDKNNRAIGVWYYKHGVKLFVRALKEIVVSGGAVDSPKLLMLSGIGPKEHLLSLGIKLKANLPVGQNLQDHLNTLVFPITIDKPLSFLADRDFGIYSIFQYIYYRQGHLASSNFLSGQAFISLSKTLQEEGIDWPDIQHTLSSAGYSSQITDMLEDVLGYRREVISEMCQQCLGQDGFMISNTLVRPKSRGEITLKDKDPFSPPVIDPNYLKHSDDVVTLIEGVKVVLKMVEETKTFRDLNAKFYSKSIPGCEKYQFRSDEYWECYVRHMTHTLWHPAGTCSMGKETGDSKAVVDSKLRVLKTKNLRVIDTSIMPVIVNGNTNAPAIMIGEKGADFIRNYWSEQYRVYLSYQPFHDQPLPCKSADNRNKIAWFNKQNFTLGQCCQ